MVLLASAIFIDIFCDLKVFVECILNRYFECKFVKFRFFPFVFELDRIHDPYAAAMCVCVPVVNETRVKVVDSLYFVTGSWIIPHQTGSFVCRLFNKKICFYV